MRRIQRCLQRYRQHAPRRASACIQSAKVIGQGGMRSFYRASSTMSIQARSQLPNALLVRQGPVAGNRKRNVVTASPRFGPVYPCNKKRRTTVLSCSTRCCVKRTDKPQLVACWWGRPTKTCNRWGDQGQTASRFDLCVTLPANGLRSAIANKGGTIISVANVDRPSPPKTTTPRPR